MVRRNLGSASPPSVMALFFILILRKSTGIGIGNIWYRLRFWFLSHSVFNTA